MDRETIERRDFPTGRRGYDPAAVDEHLRGLADEFEARAHAPAPSMATRTSEQVRLILEAAEHGASELRAAAGTEASEHVARVQIAAAGMLAKLEALESELARLFSALRSSGERLAEELAELQTQATAGFSDPSPPDGRPTGASFDASGPEAALATETSAQDGAEAALATETSAHDGAQAALATEMSAHDGAQAALATEMSDLDTAAAAPAADALVASDTTEPTLGTGASVLNGAAAAPTVDALVPDTAEPALAGDTSSTADAPAPARAPSHASPPLSAPDAPDWPPHPDGAGFDASPAPGTLFPEEGHAASPDEDDASARLIALNMALGGSSRDDTRAFLEEHFALPDPQALLDDVYARAGQ